jgi:Icc-related predicted phosphoesterase
VGVEVLEGETTVREIAGRRVGIAGVKGFGGGFAGACGSEFGEDEMKAFIRHTKRTAERLEECLRSLAADVRIALTHYSPSKGTLVGEKLEIYPFLGSYLLGDAIERAGADLALHGHAHLGTERAVTPGGVVVRNVARPVIKLAYRVYCFGASGEALAEAS